jgi:N-acetylglucosaminyldiphosphoundecaprenol N-acetyl-beta-D-mannosaminyltransferase
MHPTDLFKRITPVETYGEAANVLRERWQDTSFAVGFCNAHAVNLAYTDRNFLASMLSSDLLLRDGIGMKIAMRLMSYPSEVNANGTDLIPEMLRSLRGRRIALYGTQQPWLGIAADRVRAYGLQVCDVMDGFQKPETYLRSAALTRPGIVLLGMGMPRQEKIMVLLKQNSGLPLLIISGGAILDFLGGRFPRAPLWMRRCGLEWFFRLCLEPERLWSRYILGNPKFLARILYLRLQNLLAQTISEANAQ